MVPDGPGWHRRRRRPEYSALKLEHGFNCGLRTVPREAELYLQSTDPSMMLRSVDSDTNILLHLNNVATIYQ